MDKLVSAEEARSLLVGIAPTPWRVAPPDDPGAGEVQGADGSYVYAEGDADARIMAAAPDLAHTVIALATERDSERANGNDLADAVVRLEAERDRLRDIVACERGERAPEGWASVWEPEDNNGDPPEYVAVWAYRKDTICAFVGLSEDSPTTRWWSVHFGTAPSGRNRRPMERGESENMLAAIEAAGLVIEADRTAKAKAPVPDPNCVLNAPVEERIGLDQDLVKPTLIPGSVEVRLLGTPFALPSFVRQMAARIVHPDGTMPKDRSPGATCESIVSVWDNEVRVEGAQSSTAAAIYNAVTEHHARHREAAVEAAKATENPSDG